MHLGVGLGGWKSRSYIAERESPMRIRTHWSMYRHTERMDKLTYIFLSAMKLHIHLAYHWLKPKEEVGGPERATGLAASLCQRGE